MEEEFDSSYYLLIKLKNENNLSFKCFSHEEKDGVLVCDLTNSVTPPRYVIESSEIVWYLMTKTIEEQLEIIHV